VSGIVAIKVIVMADAMPPVMGATAKELQVSVFEPVAGTVSGVAPTVQVLDVAMATVSAPLDKRPAASGCTGLYTYVGAADSDQPGGSAVSKTFTNRAAPPELLMLTV